MWQIVQIGDTVITTGPVINFVLVALGIMFLGLAGGLVQNTFKKSPHKCCNLREHELEEEPEEKKD